MFTRVLEVDMYFGEMNESVFMDSSFQEEVFVAEEKNFDVSVGDTIMEVAEF